jgi:hypothetical protein
MFRWRLARTVLVYLVVKYLCWKLRRILRQLDAAEAEATSRTRVLGHAFSRPLFYIRRSVRVLKQPDAT